MKDLLNEGRGIQEKFKSTFVVNEFSPMGKLSTMIQIDVKERIEYTFEEYIPASVGKKLIDSVNSKIKSICEKNNGIVEFGNNQTNITFQTNPTPDAVKNLCGTIKTEVEKLINPKLFQIYVQAFVYKSGGVLGTNIGAGKIKQWIIQSGGDIGEGDKYQKEFHDLYYYDTNIPNVERKDYQRKIDKIMVSYFKQNPTALTTPTDWLKDIKSKLKT